jgi:hypothetical protein
MRALTRAGRSVYFTTPQRLWCSRSSPAGQERPVVASLQPRALRPKWSCNKWLLTLRGIFWLVQRRSKTVLLIRNEKESPPPARTCWSRHGFWRGFFFGPRRLPVFFCDYST